MLHWKGVATPSKSRVLTSVPFELYDRVKEATEKRRTYQTELLLDAFAHHHQALREQFGQSAVRDGLPPRRRPRRRHGGAVSPCVLFLHPEEKEVVDGLADELGMSRSELVTHLFERELARGDEGGGPTSGR